MMEAVLRASEFDKVRNGAIFGMVCDGIVWRQPGAEVANRSRFRLTLGLVRVLPHDSSDAPRVKVR
jgi:hypothetical protein